MASDEVPNPMAESGVTIPSDSEQYSGAEDVSTSPPSSSSPAVILYQPPTIWSILRGATINLFLPFINGMMLGFGELFAHEAAFRLGWSGTRVSSALVLLPPVSETASSHAIGISGNKKALAPHRTWHRGRRQTKAEKYAGGSRQPRVMRGRQSHLGADKHQQGRTHKAPRYHEPPGLWHR
ncbi:outer membrane protein TOM13-domain-containing protein [Lasiosphaeria miniovina]|uniref:Outer membrane protein TOM13-domain-containing protein n=1 Tax=Lasiosphaeria miniovina TaxID=1954250 RepID=A0AA40B4P4_9PEZI|nr:outer membrane protein TOM13-domain-containing protein [Lasiosphaeria miniovina]KAK0727661.1 outer membrane protein TOM13-domain-containing protein [Lasiosphaeria miniovina]